MSFPLKPHHKKLEREWYQKLKDEGFVDIEDHTREARPLKSWHNHRFKRINPQKRAALEIYYNQARALLFTYEFLNPTVRKIWELHCQGFSKRQIAVLIENETKRYKRESIGLIIVKIAREIK